MMNGKNNFSIVVFGCDNTGKTTLCEYIRKTLIDGFGINEDGVHCLHSPGPVPVESQISFMNKTFELNGFIIMDRFPVIEEATCGIVLRGYNKFASLNDPMREVDFLEKVDLFIHCNPGLEYIERWGSRQQMEGVKENSRLLNQKYNEVRNELVCYVGDNRVIEYNYNHGEAGLKEVISKIKEEAKL